MRIKKRTIMAASDIDTAFNGAFSELAGKFQDVEYKMSVNDDLDLKFEWDGSSQDESYMPLITTKTQKANGVVSYTPTLDFPKLNDEDLEFYDSIHYYTAKWEKVGRVITELIKFRYDPAKWEG